MRRRDPAGNDTNNYAREASAKGALLLEPPSENSGSGISPVIQLYAAETRAPAFSLMLILSRVRTRPRLKNLANRHGRSAVRSISVLQGTSGIMKNPPTAPATSRSHLIVYFDDKTAIAKSRERECRDI